MVELGMAVQKKRLETGISNTPMKMLVQSTEWGVKVHRVSTYGICQEI